MLDEVHQQLQHHIVKGNGAILHAVTAATFFGERSCSGKKGDLPSRVKSECTQQDGRRFVRYVINVTGLHSLTTYVFFRDVHLLLFSGLWQKDLFKGGWTLAESFSQIKLMSRLTHKVCRLLSSPVLLHKLTWITLNNKLWKVWAQESSHK